MHHQGQGGQEKVTLFSVFSFETNVILTAKAKGTWMVHSFS
jgi:hypothetical protein